MRFLHTADWHVGRTIRGRSRAEEFAAALAAVVDAAVEESVDALLLAGDIHDQRSVSPEADGLIFETLIKLSEKRIPVIAIPGNHDSPGRLVALAPLLARIQTTVVPKVLHPANGGVVEISSRDGRERGLIACVPFIPPRRFSDAAGVFEDIAAGFIDFDAGMGAMMKAYEGVFRPDAVNILMAHMFVSGSQPGGSERQITLGSDYAVSPSRLPPTASYIALGHIHRAQRVLGTGAEARYSGSLLQLDFGERGQDKSVVLVEARAGKPPKVSELAIDAGRALIDVSGTIDDLERLKAEAGNSYVRVSLSIDRPTPGIADDIRRALPNALDVRLILPERADEEAPPSLRGLDPKEQFIAYYGATHQSAPPDELARAFDAVYEDIAG